MKKIFFSILLILPVLLLAVSCSTTSSGEHVPDTDVSLETEPVLNTYEPLDLTPVVPVSSDFLVKTAAKLIPNTIKKTEQKLASSKDAASRFSLLAEAGKNYVMYANAFIQHNAQLLPMERYDEQYAELVRAKAFYLRGRDLVLDALDAKYSGLRSGLFSVDDEECEAAIGMLQKEDIENIYWCAAGWLGAFSLDPLDSDLLSTAPSAMKMLENACELVPDYDNGAIWDVLCAYYAAAPAEMGGSKEKALAAHEKTMEISGGKTISPYITYAQSICQPDSDSEGFVESLEKALQTKKPSGTTAGVAYTISKEKAQYLSEHKEDYFLDW